MMYRILLATALLALATLPPYSAEPSEQEVFTTRVYDVSGLLKHYGPRLNAPEVFVPFGAGQPGYPLPDPLPSEYYRPLHPLPGAPEALIQVLYQAAPSWLATELRIASVGGRHRLIVTGRPEAHVSIQATLVQLNAWEGLRTRIEVHDAQDGTLIGTASASAGASLVVRSTVLHSYTKESYVGWPDFGHIYPQPFHEGFEVSTTVVPKSDGRLRVQGYVMETVVDSFREREVGAGVLRLPQTRLHSRRFVEDVDNGGDLRVVTGLGRELLIRVRCEGTIEHRKIELESGERFALWNIAPMTYAYHDDRWRVASNYPFSSVGSLYNHERIPDRYTRSRRNSKGLVQARIPIDFQINGAVWGGVMVAAESTGDRFDSTTDRFTRALIQYEAPPRKFRARVWELAADDVPQDGAAPNVDPIADSTTSSLSTQATGWYDLQPVPVLEAFDVVGAGATTWPAWRDRPLGQQFRLVWNQHSVEAEFRVAHAIGEIQSFDAGLDKHGRYVLETLPTSHARLRWVGAPGGTLTAVGPVGGGRVLYGVLEPLD